MRAARDGAALPPHRVDGRAPGAQPDARADLDRDDGDPADALAPALRPAVQARRRARPRRRQLHRVPDPGRRRDERVLRRHVVGDGDDQRPRPPRHRPLPRSADGARRDRPLTGRPRGRHRDPAGAHPPACRPRARRSRARGRARLARRLRHGGAPMRRLRRLLARDRLADAPRGVDDRRCQLRRDAPDVPVVDSRLDRADARLDLGDRPLQPGQLGCARDAQRRALRRPLGPDRDLPRAARRGGGGYLVVRDMVLSRLSALHLAVAVAALALPAAAHASYGWPLKPFDQQHPVRSFFDDPRQEGTEAASFHFGIDISAPDGTPVYAVADGVVRLQPDAVALVADTGDRVFSYWHVNPVVADRTPVTMGTEIGTIKPGFGHVHFAELHNGAYVNPLRPGGITPYVDDTSPTIVTLFAASGLHILDLGSLSGTVDLLVDCYDTPPAPLPAPPWNLTRVAPAYIRWRLVPYGQTSAPWHTAVDFRSYLAPRQKFSDVYAPWTTLNRPNKPARLVYYLARGWDSRRVPDGRYRLEVAVFDSQGNSAFVGVWITVANNG